MALKHFWYSLRDEEGIPILGESVYIYKNGTTNELDIFNSAGTQLSQPLTTNTSYPSGAFDFYVKDIYSSGYDASQKMTISWSTGSVDNLDIFTNLYIVDETDTNTNPNKLVSNQMTYNWETHRSLAVSGATVVHSLYPVDETDSSNSSFNKLMNNDLMNEFYSLLVSASTISIAATGSVIETFFIDTEGGSAPAWIDTTVPSAGDYYVDLNHNFSNEYPLLSVWKISTKKVVVPSAIESIDSDNIRIWINENIQAEISIVG